MESSKVHVMAVPLPAQGNMSPMLHVAQRIAAEPGFTVTFVNVDSLHREMLKQQKQHHRKKKGLDIRFVSVPFSWSMPRGFDAEALSSPGKWFSLVEAELPSEFEMLIRQLSEEIAPVSCIISDYYMPFTQDVADRFGIPRVVLWSGPAAWSAIEYQIPQLLAKDHIFPSTGRNSGLENDPTIVDYLGGLTPMKLADVPDYFNSDDQPWKELSIKRSPVIKRASWVLVNSFYELEKETFDFMGRELGSRFLPAGPMFLLDDGESGPQNLVLRPQNNDCINWLDKQEDRSVLYISFGSIAVLSVEQFEELAAALEKSKRPFLWVIRPELVVGGTSDETYRGFCERTKDQGFIVSWAPQLRVLAHPSVGAFLTHCGWNSILESISNGVPMLGWPYGAEQNTNCKLMVSDWKIGLGFSHSVMSGLIGRDEIHATIDKIFDSEQGFEMKSRVEKLKSLARHAMDKQGGRSLQNLMAFLRDLKP